MISQSFFSGHHFFGWQAIGKQNTRAGGKYNHFRRYFTGAKTTYVDKLANGFERRVGSVSGIIVSEGQYNGFGQSGFIDDEQSGFILLTTRLGFGKIARCI